MNTSIQNRNNLGRILKAAASYFAMVFGTGFVLGTIRVLWAVPHLGVRNAELLEQPFMLVAVFLAARWVIRRFGAGLTKMETVGIGLIALGVVLLAEVWVVLLLQSNRDHDPISGAAYVLMLGVFAIMPWLVSRRERSRSSW
jgi:hypothetical protein